MEVIKTERLTLRKLHDSDREELFLIFNDIAVDEYISGFYCETLEDLDFLLESTFDFKREFCFIVEDSVSKKIVGFIHSRVFIEYIAHTSYITRADERGKGYMSEALKAYINYMYKNNLASTIHFTIRNDNIPSIKVMGKLNIDSCMELKNFKHYHLPLLQKPSF